MAVGLEPSSGLRVRKKRKETTIIEVNTIYSPQVLNGWDSYMARPRWTQKRCTLARTHTNPHTHKENRRTKHGHPLVPNVLHTHTQNEIALTLTSNSLTLTHFLRPRNTQTHILTLWLFLNCYFFPSPTKYEMFLEKIFYFQLNNYNSGPGGLRHHHFQ